MSKKIVVYWSMTGNTEIMARTIYSALKEKDPGAVIVNFDDVTPDEVAGYDVIALGCPAMGDEVLEESTVDPFFEELEGKISGKKIALFGSYDWGSGDWMRSWESRVTAAGAEIVDREGLIAHLTPDEDAKAACRALGEAMAAL